MAARRRFVVAAPVWLRPVADDPQARAPTPADAPALAGLLWQACRDTIEDEGESPEDARVEIQRLFDGDYGPMLWAESEVTERTGQLVSATLLTVFGERPFVAYVLTSPAHQGRGMACAGLLRAINRLAAGGNEVVRLVVIQGNAPAERLYKRLGFRPEAQPPFTTA